MSESYIDFVTGTHSLYDKYQDDWELCLNSFYGGVEYKDARYLRAYQVDLNTPSETINTYMVSDDGSYVSKHKAKVEYGQSSNQVNRGQDLLDGSFYLEKLENTPLYNYVKLVVSEYNSILMRNPTARTLPDYPGVTEFINDVSGEGDNINEFMSLVDQYITIFGVCHVGCYKPIGSDIPKWKIHTPLEVTNWSYRYNIDGNLELDRVVIQVEDSDYHSVYRLITKDQIDTVFLGKDSEDDYLPPVNDPRLEQIGDNVYRITQDNELGEVPIVTAYQNLKVYNNIGSTVIQDVAQIQRSVYGYSAEAYSAITYSSHPTLVVDETTDQLNDGQVGAEPGAVMRVQAGLTGEPAYVYEFVSPELNSIEQIMKLIDSQIDKLIQISMLRSEDLIKSSRSGEQIEVYDDKLAALIRRKATNLENMESKLWDLYFMWTNQNKPDDFSVSYNRQFNKKALEHELNEVNLMMNVLEKYRQSFAGTTKFTAEKFATSEEAEQRASELGGSGFHSHDEDGTTIYMPFSSHEEYERALERANPGVDYEEETDFEETMRDKIRQRLEQLLDASTTNNGL